MEQVVLVDEQDNEIGVMEKLQAHIEGRRHRAISVFIFNSRGELLLQQRATGKYHSAGLWTNTCCSHPRPGEAPQAAATRRLHEEMGIASELREAFTFVYKAQLENSLTEYEYDHVFTGTCDDVPQPDASEASAWRYIKPEDVLVEVSAQPERFTEWFKICISDWRRDLFNMHDGER